MTARQAFLLFAAALATGCAAQPGNGSGDATAIDLIVAGDHVVTMDGDRPVLENGAVAVDDGFIVAIGPREEIAQRYRARETLDGKDRVVLPGLINGHAHSAMTLMRGIADDRELMDWLRNYIFPTEVRFVDASSCGSAPSSPAGR